MEIIVENLTLLSRGSNSSIYLYGDRIVKGVLKVVNNSNSKQAAHLRNQYKVLSKINHENIISCSKLRQHIYLEDIVQSREIKCKVDCSVLVLEYANQASLLDFIRKNTLSITQVRYLFQQICEAVEYLHCNYIVHRDLKLQNILIHCQGTKIKSKLADFGFAANYYQDGKIKEFNSFRGTKRGYMAPQIHQTLLSPNKYYDARKTDVFALGVVLFALVMGKLPFQYATNDNRIYKMIIEQQYQQFWKNHIVQLSKLELKEHSMVQDFKDLFILMVCESPSKRLTIEDVLQHQWLQGIQKVIQ